MRYLMLLSARKNKGNVFHFFTCRKPTSWKNKSWNENNINAQCMRILGNGFIICDVETCMNKDKKWNYYESEFHRIL